jgi:hypothetical protein
MQKEEAQVDYQQWAQRLGFQHVLPPVEATVSNPIFITAMWFIVTK